MTEPSLARVLLVHNSYRHAGGEDQVFVTEAQVLRERGHHVTTYARQNPSHGGAGLLTLAAQAIWNHRSYVELRALIRQARPDVMHLHNTFPLISPAAHYAARGEGVATVQTLHNYRLVCPSGLLFRNGRPCEDCVHKSVPWPGVVHACYRDSHAASLAAAATISLHHGLGTWATQVDRYIALTEFARDRFVAGGLRADSIAVKPNVVYPDPGASGGGGGYALFVGRLSPEKGLQVLLDAWRRLKQPRQLVIAGDGPLSPLVAQAAAEDSLISWRGHQSREEVQALLGRAACLIVPSVWYETFGLVVAEGFARGTPVVAARLGALAELVDHGRTGLQFTPGDPDDLARQVAWFFDNPVLAASMRKAARAEYERRYSVESNYPMLCRIYADAIARRRGDR